MSWDDSQQVEPTEVKEGPKQEPDKVQETDAEPIKTEEGQEPTDPPKEDLVPQRLIGQVAKKIREKGRAEVDAVSRENAELRARIQQLEEGGVEQAGDATEIEQRVRQEVRQTFLAQQDAYGKEKYGKDYSDACLLIQSQNDPVLINKIYGAANPADTLMKEAQKLAEEIAHADDPGWRERELEEKLRAKIEAEYAGKLKAANNQPTDVQTVRTAGGDVKPEPRRETWATTLK